MIRASHSIALVTGFESSWLLLRVREFCEHSNWSGYSRFGSTAEGPLEEIDMNHGQSRSPVVAESDNWLNLTLGQFFSDANWEGKLIVRRPTVQSPDALPAANLSLSVAEFWGSLPWTGKPTIAAMPQGSLPPRSAEDSFTLSDLSDLF